MLARSLSSVVRLEFLCHIVGFVLNHDKVHVYSIPFSEEEVNLTVGTVFVMCAYKSEMNQDFENVFNNMNKLYTMIVCFDLVHAPIVIPHEGALIRSGESIILVNLLSFRIFLRG